MRRRGHDGGAGARPAADDAPGFVRQVGLFESANGMPHGPVAILLAIVMAILVLPVARFVRWLIRR
jgi:hypothetical protein